MPVPVPTWGQRYEACSGRGGGGMQLQNSKYFVRDDVNCASFEEWKRKQSSSAYNRHSFAVNIAETNNSKGRICPAKKSFFGWGLCKKLLVVQEEIYADRPPQNGGR